MDGRTDEDVQALLILDVGDDTYLLNPNKQAVRNDITETILR